MERLVVVGAGAMGCFFAARLSESGVAVDLVDVDDSRIASLTRDGIDVDDVLGRRVVPIVARRADKLTGVADLIIMFTKGVHTAAAVASIAHLVGPATRALTLQNGIGNADAIAVTVPADRILVGVTDIPCDLVGPTSVASHGHGSIMLGAFVGDDRDAADTAAAMLRGAGFVAAADADVGVAIWEKVAFNAAMNALCTVTGLRVGGLDSDPGRRLIGRVIDEVVAVARGTGIVVDTARIAAKIDLALANHVTHQPSMLQDRLAGRPTEIETINGAVVRAAAVAGIATPVNQTLMDLVRTIEAAATVERLA